MTTHHPSVSNVVISGESARLYLYGTGQGGKRGPHRLRPPRRHLVSRRLLNTPCFGVALEPYWCRFVLQRIASPRANPSRRCVPRFPTYRRFHVDKLSSAHVYVRLPEGQTWDDITEELLEDCCQLVKANSIEGVPPRPRAHSVTPRHLSLLGVARHYVHCNR